MRQTKPCGKQLIKAWWFRVRKEIINARRHRGGDGGGDTPPRAFLTCPPKRRADPAETLQTVRDAPCATIGKRIARSGQVTELWCYKWNNLGSIFRLPHVFTNVTCSHWLELRHYVLFRSEYDHIWPLTLSLDSSKAIRSHWPRMTQYLLIVAKLTWVIWCPSEVTVSFLVIFCIFLEKVTISFRNAIHPNYSIKILIQHVNLLRIELETLWRRFQCATINSFFFRY